uniref:Uncharacterized protein n=1 Tax=Leersia perrieri TaxID=77586 RepID=A0A0D9XBB2_9ORYZ
MPRGVIGHGGHRGLSDMRDVSDRTAAQMDGDCYRKGGGVLLAGLKKRRCAAAVNKLRQSGPVVVAAAGGCQERGG